MPESDFESMMKTEFPEGDLPIPAAVLGGDDHMALHFVEGLVQVMDTFGITAELIPAIQAVHGGVEFSVSEEDSLMAGLLWYAKSLIEMRALGGLDRQLAWVRDVGAACASGLVAWMHDHGIPQYIGWVHLINHGFVPFMLDKETLANPHTAGTTLFGFAGAIRLEGDEAA